MNINRPFTAQNINRRLPRTLAKGAVKSLADRNGCYVSSDDCLSKSLLSGLWRVGRGVESQFMSLGLIYSLPRDLKGTTVESRAKVFTIVGGYSILISKATDLTYVDSLSVMRYCLDHLSHFFPCLLELTAFCIMVSHLSCPSTLIPQASAGVLPSRASCGLT